MLRIARAEDVLALNELRLAVRENRLADPGWLTEARTLEAITRDGRGWVFEEAEELLGFSVASRSDALIWALFVRPGCEGRGSARPCSRRPLAGSGIRVSRPSG